MQINVNSLIHFCKKACLVIPIKKIVTKQKVSMRQNSAKSYYKLYPPVGARLALLATSQDVEKCGYIQIGAVYYSPSNLNN